jgi:DNA-binding CsgD family transcriptional regulator
MREVNVRMVHFVAELARVGGLDEAKLLSTLPLSLRGGTMPSWIDWNDFVELFERLEQSVGGPDALERVARLAVPTAYPELRAFAAIFVSPLSLFTFAIMRHMKTSFKNVVVEELERSDDGRIRWRETIPAHDRPSEAFHRFTRTIAALMPMHLDLPEAPAEIVSMTPHVAEFVATFSPEPPLVARGRHAALAVTSLIAAQLDEAYAIMIGAARPGHAEGGQPNSVGAEWADRLALSPRQRDVFALTLEGRTNKSIAAELTCSERNVEFHLGRILRAARVTSRAELLVKVLGSRT